jgi:hypothetical protein
MNSAPLPKANPLVNRMESPLLMVHWPALIQTMTEA